jgi:hypothetical protein
VVYENDTGSTDANGQPHNSVCAVVLGGDSTAVATAIGLKKAPGITTYGSTSIVIYDSKGVPRTINFYELALQQVFVTVNIMTKTGYTGNTAALIQSAVSDFVDNLDIGAAVEQTSLYGPADLRGDEATGSTNMPQSALDLISKTYKITSITLGTAASPTGTADIEIPFNAAAVCPTTNVVVMTS